MCCRSRRCRPTGRYDLRDRPVCGQGLDHGFGGWSGRRGHRRSGAALPRSRCPRPTRASSSSIRPTAGGLFVAEPVTHANAALNAPEEEWAELGLRVLEPGETMSLTMRVEVIRLIPPDSSGQAIDQ